MIRRGFQEEAGAYYDRDTFDTGYNVVLRRGCVIGQHVCIWSNTVIDAEAIVGDHTRIHCNCYVAQRCIIGQWVFIGPGTVLMNDRYPMRRDPGVWEPVIVHNRAVIGGGVGIGPGVTIGEGAMIGFGSVVTKDVPDYQAWAGNPARRLPWEIEDAWLKARDQVGLLDTEEAIRLIGGV